MLYPFTAGISCMLKNVRECQSCGKKNSIEASKVDTLHQELRRRHWCRVKKSALMTNFRKFPVTMKKTRQSKKPQKIQALVNYKKYSSHLPTSGKKKEDLLILCNDGTIPEYYHPFYKPLQASIDDDQVPTEPGEQWERMIRHTYIIKLMGCS